MAKLFGTKKIMTQMYAEDGKVIPVTVVDLADTVVAYKSDDRALIGVGKIKNGSQSEVGIYAELGYVPAKVVEVDVEQVVDMKVGDKYNVATLAGVVKVDIIGTSKGKGFQGVVKRYGFAGGPKTHGQSDRERAPGSIGAGTTPGRVWKGKKMPGRMGGNRITVKNLKVVKIDEENNLLMVKGAIPGAKNARIIISFVK